jgi:restriction endonuclease S subunit
MNQAYAEKQRLEQKADELLASINGYILENLGIKSPQDKRKAIFSINSSDVKGQRLDPHFYSIKSPDLEEIVPLDSLVTFSKETWDQKSIYADYFPYIEISEIETISGQINNVSWLPKDKAPSRAKMIVRAGDIIVSTTRPHRGAIARITAEYDQYIASTGFAIIRTIKKKSLLKDFLFYVLRTNFVLNQMIQRSTGGNYPAITLQELKKVQVPVANIKTQQSIIKEVQSCVNKAADLKKQALFTINKAKADVENILFGEEA